MVQRADRGDLMRKLLDTMPQSLVVAQATAHIVAEPHERSDARRTQRNGSRPKTVTTANGDVTVKVLKTRNGSFFPSLLESRRRIGVALHAVICQACAEGVSTRRVDDLVVAMGGTGIRKSEVSRICGHLDEDVAAWRSRSLDEIAFPHVLLDATYCKARINQRVVSQAVVLATGVSADGCREVLGCAVGGSETEVFWTEFLRSTAKQPATSYTTSGDVIVQDQPNRPRSSTQTLSNWSRDRTAPSRRSPCSSISSTRSRRTKLRRRWPSQAPRPRSIQFRSRARRARVDSISAWT